MILVSPPTKEAFRQIINDAFPGLAAIGTLDHVRTVVASFVIIDASVNSIRIVSVGFNVVNKKELGNAKDLIDFGPVFATIFGNLN